MEYELALSTLRQTKEVNNSEKIFLEKLITIWKNNGSMKQEDSALVNRISKESKDPGELLLLGSFYLFNGKRNDALPILLESLQLRDESDENLIFITYLGILEIYSKMFVLSDQYPFYLNELNRLANSSVVKKAWFLAHKMKYNGARPRDSVSIAQHGEWIKTAHEFYENSPMSNSLMAIFSYQFGSAYKFYKDSIQAESAFYQVIELGKDKEHLRHTLFNTYLQLAGIMSATGRFDSARELFSESQNFRSGIDPMLFEMNYNNAIAIDLFEKTNQWDSAYFHLKYSIGSILPVFIEENNLWVEELRETYEARRREEEIAYQDQQIKDKNRLIFLAIISGILLIALLLTLAVAFRGIKRKNQKIEILMRELHHRVKNNLQVVSSLLGLQSLKLKDEKAKKAVSEGKSRIRAMSLIHQKLYQNEEFSSLNIRDYLTNLTAELIKAYGFNDKISLTLDLCNESFDGDSALPLGLMVNEMVSNALKHGLNIVENPELTIALIRSSQRYILTVSDNGPGIQETNDSIDSGSFGLKLIEILTKQIGGELVVTGDNGTIYKVTFALD